MSFAGRPPTRNGPRSRALRAFILALAVGVALSACGSSGKGLIPVAHAGPLLSDFEAVRQAAESGAGNCSATDAALAKTEEDFAALPPSVDRGLRANLRQGIANLRDKAHEKCAQLTTGTHTTTTTKTTTTTPPPVKTTPTGPTGPTGPTASPPTGGREAPGGAQAPGGESPSQGAGGGGEPSGGSKEEEAAGGAGAPENAK
jgi:hypothetical protein